MIVKSMLEENLQVLYIRDMPISLPFPTDTSTRSKMYIQSYFRLLQINFPEQK